MYIEVINDGAQVLGREEFNYDNAISVHPNPTKGKVTIQSNSRGEITLFDITGKKVLQKRIDSSTELDLIDYQSGLYQLRFKSENGIVEYRKLIKE